MEKVLKIVTKGDETSDAEYWQNKSELERLKAIEFLRDQYIKFNKNAKSGFQRVCTIIRKA